jgi:hypothetical protein
LGWQSNFFGFGAVLQHVLTFAEAESPGMFVEHCISLARCITQEHYSQLVNIDLVTGKTVDKLVHEAMKGYLEGFGVQLGIMRRLSLASSTRTS